MKTGKTDNQRIVSELAEILGAKLVAFIASVKDTRTVMSWADGKLVCAEEVIARLCLAHELAVKICKVEGRETTQAWFQGLNPLLGDASPARLLREGDLGIDGPRVRSAAYAFLANG
jgi:hypothetical protein